MYGRPICLSVCLWVCRSVLRACSHGLMMWSRFGEHGERGFSKVRMLTATHEGCGPGSRPHSITLAVRSSINAATKYMYTLNWLA